MKAARAVLAITVAALAAGAAAEEPDPPAIDPQAAAIAGAAASFLAEQPSFAFQWFVSYDEVIDGREKITRLASGRTLMDRSIGFVSETERADGLLDFYYDGTTFTVSAPDRDFFASAAFDGGFDALVGAVRERTGSVVPLWSIMSPTLPERLLSTVERAAYLGVVPLAGQTAHHLAFADYDEDWQAWISTDEDAPLLLMLIGTDPYRQGWPQYRAYLSGWDLEPQTDPAMFEFLPDVNDVPVAMPDLAAALAGEPTSGAAEGAPQDDAAPDPEAGAEPERPAGTGAE